MVRSRNLADGEDNPQMLLVGDVGGTKTDLALIEAGTDPRDVAVCSELPSARYASLEDLVRDFLDDHSALIEAACFAVAGPVIAGRARVTNLPWVADEAALSQALTVPVRLINDLEATARSVPLLDPNDLLTLNQGATEPHGTIAVVAPGTGLGEAFLVWDGSRYRAHQSEGGHSDFAPTSARQIELLRYMRSAHRHVSYEHVCSGIGIPNIYRFLRDTGVVAETPAIAARLAAADDPTPIIVDAAVHQTVPDPLSSATIEMFVAILGAEAGNLALKVLATGGVFLGGGLPLHLLPALESGPFMRSFANKGRLSNVIGRLPVHVILRRAALIGAADAAIAESCASQPAEAGVTSSVAIS